MSLNPKKRQKKLEQKKAQRKSKKQEVARVKSAGLVGQIKQSVTLPIHECWQGDGLFHRGMGQILVSRKMPDGFMIFSVFLLDTWCLGVKDVYCGILGPFEYSKKFAPHHLPSKLIDIAPAEARKIVEGAVAFAKRCGFAPHPDYNKAKLIFGDINPEECTKEFEFGKDGVPHFMPGPHDNPSRCKQVLMTLDRNCGPGNYHYTMMMDEAAGLQLEAGDFDFLKELEKEE
jgi:hypothetical protein